MWVLYHLLFGLMSVVIARDWSPPILKKGLVAHRSKLSRTYFNNTNYNNTSSNHSNNNNSNNNQQVLQIGLSLSSSNQSVILELQPNNNLLSPLYEEIEISSDGEKRVLRSFEQIRMCWFHGKIKGDPRSEVIVSDCDGFFEGVIRTGDGKNHIAKPGESEDDVSIHAQEDEEQFHGACGVHEHASSLPSGLDEHHDEDIHTMSPVSPPAGRRRLLDYSTSVNVVEMAVVSDHGYLQGRGGLYGRNLTAVAQLNIQLMNIVQATYLATTFAKPTSVRLKAQYFLSSSDPYTMTKDSNGEVDQNVLLDAFTNFSVTLPKYDHIHLLTYYDLLADTVGYAHTSSACTNQNTAISMGTNTAQRVANTMAHELGHVLGMVHDGQTTCNATGYLMSATNSCPESGLCSFSSCSITAKNTYTATVTCLFNWTESSCTDGVWNGNETGVDCGGNCAACTGQTGCLVNKSGCAQTCTPVGQADFLCGCNSTSYVDPVNGLDCITDINQCLLTNSPCDGSCVNLLAPGGVYQSFTCGCTSPKVLSALDGVTCALPSCYDRVKNQNEVLTDCGGSCPNSCNCLVSNGTWHYGYDRGFSIAGAQWRSTTASPNQYQLLKAGVPIRYLYQMNNSQWFYDDDNTSSGYYGTIFQGGAVPPSGTWQVYTGVKSVFAPSAFNFVACSSVPSVCGNGKIEGGEMCDSCLVYTGGVCVKPNPCCDSACLAPRPRGLSCHDQHNLPGACWEGSCITRDAACDVVTTLNCFGNPCVNSTGGAECGAVPDVFTSTSCDAPLSCYVDCAQTDLNSDPPIGAIRGFPCSSVGADGMYSSVCSGGSQGNGRGSVCMSVTSLSEFLTAAPTHTPTTSAPTLPTSSPVTRSPTLPTTHAPTTSPTTPQPTKAPTSKPTSGPTTPTVRSISGAGILYVSGLFWLPFVFLCL